MDRQSVSKESTGGEQAGWVIACIVGGFFSLLLAPCAGMVCNPPQIFPEWLLSGGAGAGVMGLSLWRSAYTRSSGERAGFAVAILLSAPAVLVPLYSWYASFHDFPWLLILPGVLALLRAGWRRGQRWLLLAVLGFIACCGYTPSLPARTRLPRTIQRGGVTLTVESMERNQHVAFCQYTVRTEKGQRLLGDLQEVHGSAGSLLPVRCWPAHEWPREPGQPPEEARFVAYTFPPTWLRSYDLTFEVQLVPPKPAVTLDIPLPPRGSTLTRPVTASGNGITVTASNVRWLSEHSQSRKVLFPEFHLEYRGYTYGGSNGKEFRATTLNGRPLQFRVSSIIGEQNVSMQDAYLENPPQSIRGFRICAYNEEQLAVARRVIRVRGLPNPH